MAESPSVWTRLRGQFDWLDSIDLLTYGGLGLALLGYTVYSIATALLRAEQTAAFVGFTVVIAFSAAALVRDLRRKQFSVLSKGIAGAWATCTLLIIAAELIESFS